jgi:hypothetical protein
MRWVLLFVVLALIAWLTLSLYRGRGRMGGSPASRQALARLPFPQPPLELAGPEGAALMPATTAMYLGTTMAGDWNDPVEVGDIAMQAPATLHVSPAGLLVDRTGASPLWVPAGSVRGARLGRSVAGRVQTGDGLLVVTWQLGGHLLDTGFHGDQAQYPDLLRTLRALADRAPGKGVA